MATISVTMLAEVQQMRKGIDDVNSRLGKLGGVATKAGSLMKFAIAGAAAGAVVSFGKSVVNSASQAQQSLGGTQAVFGKFADTVIKTSNEAATKYGLSANQYRESANIIGSLFKNQGVSMDELAKKTDNQIGLASDLAATYGGTTADAVSALSAAFKGEFDPLEKYGISLKASAVSAEAAKIGHLDSAAALQKLSAAQQAHLRQLATQKILTKQSADAQGQFGKQTNTLAEQQQILGAQWDNFKVKLGNVLIPVVTKVFQLMNNNLGPAIKKVGDFLSPLVDTIGGSVRAWESSHDAAGGFSDTLHNKVLPILSAISDFFQKEWVKIGPSVRQVFGSVKQIISNALGIITQLTKGALIVLSFVWKHFGATITKFLGHTLENAVQVIKGAFQIIGGIFKFFNDLLHGRWSKLWGDVKQILSGAMNVIKGTVKQAFNIIGTVVKIALIALGNIIRGAWRGYIALVRAQAGFLVGLIRQIPGRIGAIAGAMAGAGRRLIGSLFSGILAAARSAGGFVGSLISAIKGAVNSALNLPLSIDVDKGPFHLHQTVIPALASGGIVSKPTLALIGEAGPEAVVPLNGRHGVRGFGGGYQDVTINVDVSAGGIVYTQEELGSMILRAVKAAVDAGELEYA